MQGENAGRSYTSRTREGDAGAGVDPCHGSEAAELEAADPTAFALLDQAGMGEVGRGLQLNAVVHTINLAYMRS